MQLELGPNEIKTKPRDWTAPYLPAEFKIEFKELREVRKYPGKVSPNDPHVKEQLPRDIFLSYRGHRQHEIKFTYT